MLFNNNFKVVDYYMEKSKVIILILIFAFLKSNAETVVGCKIGNDTFLYTGYQGVKPYPVSQYYIPTFPTYTTPTKDFLNSWYTSYNNCPYFDGNPTYGEQCAVSGITVVSNGRVNNLGQTITYTLTYNCPIDTYSLLLLILTGVTGVVFIYRRV